MLAQESGRRRPNRTHVMSRFTRILGLCLFLWLLPGSVPFAEDEPSFIVSDVIYPTDFASNGERGGELRWLSPGKKFAYWEWIFSDLDSDLPRGDRIPLYFTFFLKHSDKTPLPVKLTFKARLLNPHTQFRKWQILVAQQAKPSDDEKKDMIPYRGVHQLPRKFISQGGSLVLFLRREPKEKYPMGAGLTSMYIKK
ncbi:MAG: hypothetical protein HYU64_04700 [Armatimonadetes bacterium]|nr:hypothetical protein [Armatimonadota bacterium]